MMPQSAHLLFFPARFLNPKIGALNNGLLHSFKRQCSKCRQSFCEPLGRCEIGLWEGKRESKAVTFLLLKRRRKKAAKAVHPTVCTSFYFRRPLMAFIGRNSAS